MAINRTLLSITHLIRRRPFFSFFIFVILCLALVNSIYMLTLTPVTLNTSSVTCTSHRNKYQGYTLFDHTSDTLPREHDLMSAISFKFISDYYYGTSSVPEGEMRNRLTYLNKDSIHCLHDGDVIFVDIIDLPSFAGDILPLIQTSFVLVTGVTDFSPGDLFTIWNKREALKDIRLFLTLIYYMISHGAISLDYLRSLLLSHPLILHWYAMNCDDNYGHNFSCIPIGISQWGDQTYQVSRAIQEGFGLYHGLHVNEDVEKYTDKLVLNSYGVFTNPSERQPLYNLACIPGQQLASFSDCDYSNNNGGYTGFEFYAKLSHYKFVYSPHGRGLDCYRTYEALYMNTYPIVKTSSLDSLYKDLPVLIVNSWGDITYNLLNETFFKFRSGQFRYEKLYTKYYYDLFHSHK